MITSSSPSPSTYWKPSPLLLPITLIFFILSAQESDAQQSKRPPNDACTAAIPLTPNATVTVGSTVGAVSSAWCDDIYNFREDRNAWYSVTGTGNIMSVTTCFPETTYTTTVSVQTSCVNSGCVFYDAWYYKFPVMPCSSINGATYTWESVANQAYLIRVASALGGNTTGTFGLSVTDFPAPKNSQCAKALPISSLGAALNGTTVNSTFSLFCSSPYVLDRMVWYSVTGTGNQMTASTCHPETDYASAVAVQTTCASECTAISTQQDQCAVATWSSIPGQAYLIAVGSDGQSQQVGNFGFSVTDNPPPSNGNCQDATPLTVNGPKVAGTTIAAPLSTLCDGYWEYPSVWYSFNGTGNIMTVTTCSRQADNVVEVAVQSSCDSSSCVTNEDLGLKLKCQTTNNGYMVTFDSVQGQTYYANIGGTDIVKFNVSVDDYPGPPNDSCESAEPITLSIEKTVNASGSTKLAVASAGCDSTLERFVWYSFFGTGGTVTLSTCSQLSDFDAELAVQTSCGASECLVDIYSNQGCVDGQNGNTVEFLSIKGQKYLVRVGSSSSSLWGSTTGSFGLTLTAAALGNEQSGSDDDEGSVSTNSPSSYEPSGYDPTLPPLPMPTGNCEEAFFDCFISKMSPGELASCSDCILTKMDPFASGSGCDAATKEFCSNMKQCSSCAPCQSDLEKYMSCQIQAMTELGGHTCTFSSCSTILDDDSDSDGLSSGAIIGIVVAGFMAALGVIIILFWVGSKAASGKQQNKDEDLEDSSKPEMTLTGQEEEECHSGQSEAK